MKELLRINSWLKKGNKSKWPLFTMRKVTSGIPQESVLRSVLLIFMKHLEKVVNSKMTNCAEDTFLSKRLGRR